MRDVRALTAVGRARRAGKARDERVNDTPCIYVLVFACIGRWYVCAIQDR